MLGAKKMLCLSRGSGLDQALREPNRGSPHHGMGGVDWGLRDCEFALVEAPPHPLCLGRHMWGLRLGDGRQSMGDWQFEEIWHPKRQISSKSQSPVVCLSPCRSIQENIPRFILLNRGRGSRPVAHPACAPSGRKGGMPGLRKIDIQSLSLIHI